MKSFLLLFVFFFATSVFAQEGGSISGQILDKDTHYEPMIFAQVQLRNTPVEVQTNFHGTFKISSLKPGDYVVVVRYPGYQKLEIPVTINNNEDILIKEVMNMKRIAVEELSNRATTAKKPVSVAVDDLD